MFRFTFIILISALFSLQTFSAKPKQTKEELQKMIEKNKKDITYADELLRLTKEDKKVVYHHITIVDKKISLRNQLISNLNEEVDTLSKDIEYQQMSIVELEQTLVKYKKEYEHALVVSYKYRNLNDLLTYLLASESIEQAYKRLQYFKEYSKYRRQQIQKIEETKTNLSSKVNKLEKTKRNKETLISQKTIEKKLLDQEKIKKDQYVKELKIKEKGLKQTIKEKELTNIKLEKQIQKIIEEEIRIQQALERKRKLEAEKREKERKERIAKENVARLANAKKTQKQEPAKQVLTAQEQQDIKITNYNNKVTGDFVSNKGNLNPPVNGVIVSKFGRHQHPILSKITIDNPGIDIQTKPNTSVRSIFSGEVRKIFAIPGKNKALIIRHGNYLSVYSNLQSVNVKVGDIVNIGQALGVVYSDDSSNSILHFEIWEETTKYNPEEWINI